MELPALLHAAVPTCRVQSAYAISASFDPGETDMARRLLILDTELEMGGKEKLLYEFLARADRNRFRVAVCCLKPGGYFKEKIVALGVPFYDDLLRHRFDAMAFRELAHVIRAEKTEIVETFAHPNTVIFSFLAKLRSMVQSVVVSYHALAVDPHENIVRPYLRPVLRRLDAHIAVAEIQKRHLVGVEGLREESVRVIYNGVDTGAFRPADPAERSATRRTLGLADDAVVLMTVGSLKPIKGADVLLRAVAPLMREQPRLRLVLVGDGPDRGSLERQARELSIADRVSFLGLRADVDRLLRAADALVLPSRSEALPTVLLEAMAAGLPVVATRVGGVPEIVDEDRSGLMVPPEDASALGGALARIASDPALRRSLGQRGRAVVESRFRVETMCENRMAYFEEVLARGPATAGVS
jgi:glycosyltransferase involved in cell wall biosynthesis